MKPQASGQEVNVRLILGPELQPSGLLGCAPVNTGIPLGFFPLKSGNRGFGRENSSPNSDPGSARFPEYFSCFRIFLQLRYTISICGIRHRLVWDLPVPGFIPSFAYTIQV